MTLTFPQSFPYLPFPYPFSINFYFFSFLLLLSNPFQDLFPYYTILLYSFPHYSYCPSLLFHCIPASPPSTLLILLSIPFPSLNTSTHFPFQANKKSTRHYRLMLNLFLILPRKSFSEKCFTGICPTPRFVFLGSPRFSLPRFENLFPVPTPYFQSSTHPGFSTPSPLLFIITYNSYYIIYIL